MSRTVPLSVLDLAPVSTGQTGGEALRTAVDLAGRVEGFGYHRYWLAEHHLAPGVASAAPAVLAEAAAARTSTIRVGSAAVLLGNVTPLEAAEQFGTVAQLHPGRVDLGLGRSVLTHLDELAGPKAQPAAQRRERTVDGLLVPAPPAGAGGKRRLERLREQADLLAVPAGERPYREQVEEVLAFLGGTHRGAGGELHSVPAEGADLDVWVLGSSAGPSARAAGALGLPFAASYHISPSTVLETVEAYRAAFAPAAGRPEPQVVVSADVVVADDDETARELAEPYAEWVHSIRVGDGADRYRSPGQARAARWTDEARALVDDRVRTQFVGSPGRVVQGLRALQRGTGADELLITTVTHEHADRVRSYELLARAWQRAG